MFRNTLYSKERISLGSYICERGEKNAITQFTSVCNFNPSWCCCYFSFLNCVSWNILHMFASIVHFFWESPCVSVHVLSIVSMIMKAYLQKKLTNRIILSLFHVTSATKKNEYIFGIVYCHPDLCRQPPLRVHYYHFRWKFSMQTWIVSQCKLALLFLAAFWHFLIHFRTDLQRMMCKSF